MNLRCPKCHNSMILELTSDERTSLKKYFLGNREKCVERAFNRIESEKMCLVCRTRMIEDLTSDEEPECDAFGYSDEERMHTSLILDGWIAPEEVIAPGEPVLVSTNYSYEFCALGGHGGKIPKHRDAA